MVQSWTEAEKLGLLFQIIEKAGSIPWDDLVLPEGRTKKACVVMVDKEKAKVRKACGGNGTAGEERGEGGGAKRKVDDGDNEDGEATPKAKKQKTPRKKKETPKAKAAREAEEEDEDGVKAEPEGQDEFL